VTTWTAPLGNQLELLVRWLDPVLERPGLTRVPLDDLHVVIGDSALDDAPPFEPFDALVGPVQIEREGVVAGVEPLEPFLALRELLGSEGPYAPRVVFAHADGSAEYEPLEAIASEAVVVSTIQPCRSPS
jgi:hypothetical protein